MDDNEIVARAPDPEVVAAIWVEINPIVPIAGAGRHRTSGNDGELLTLQMVCDGLANGQATYY